MYDLSALIVAIIALLVGIIAAFAAIIVVPEVRKLLGLERKLEADKIVRIDISYGAMDQSGVILDFNPNTPYGYYHSNNLIAYEYPILSIDVTSLSDKEYVKIDPYIEVNILKAIRLDNPDFYREVVDGIGGGGDPKKFLLPLSPPERRSIYAAWIKDWDIERFKFEYAQDGSYINLQPGEFETLSSIILMSPGYYYEFSISIPISYNGKRVTIRPDRVFRCAKPIRRKEWVATSTSEYSWMARPDATFVPHESDQNYLHFTDQITAEQIKEVEKQISTLPQIIQARRR